MSQENQPKRNSEFWSSGKKEGEPKETTIEQLSGAFRKARFSRGENEYLFVGWTKDERPAVVDSIEKLGEDSRNNFEEIERSGLPIREIPYTSLTPLEYLITGAVKDIIDEDPRHKSEDITTYAVKNDQDQTQTLSFGETVILRAIEGAQQYWQDTSPDTLNYVETEPNIIEPKKMYTVIIPSHEHPRNQALALMFKPLIKGASNEGMFYSFVQKTIGGLLVVDEMQKPEFRKGYIESAGRYAGIGSSSTSIELLKMLREAGFIDYDENLIENIRTMGRGLLAGGLDIAERLGFIDIDDAVLDHLRDPLPNYNISSLESDKLFGLVSDMRSKVEDAIGRGY